MPVYVSMLFCSASAFTFLLNTLPFLPGVPSSRVSRGRASHGRASHGGRASRGRASHGRASHIPPSSIACHSARASLGRASRGRASHGRASHIPPSSLACHSARASQGRASRGTEGLPPVVPPSRSRLPPRESRWQQPGLCGIGSGEDRVLRPCAWPPDRLHWRARVTARFLRQGGDCSFLNGACPPDIVCFTPSAPLVTPDIVCVTPDIVCFTPDIVCFTPGDGRAADEAAVEATFDANLTDLYNEAAGRLSRALAELKSEGPSSIASERKPSESPELNRIAERMNQKSAPLVLPRPRHLRSSSHAAALFVVVLLPPPSVPRPLSPALLQEARAPQ